MHTISVTILQILIFLAAAPLLSGLITKLKNNLRMRQGQSVFWPYYNLVKLFSKDEAVSETASWIFRVAPFVVIASTLTAAALVPVFVNYSPAAHMGDFLAFIFILALGRFFMALAALDAGSAFGGMGSSREMFISSLVEPALLLIIFSLSLQAGSTNILTLSLRPALMMSSIIAAAALFFVMIAETSRIPVDNQETHLELTMIHEAMVLEYSGRSLAFIEMAGYIKQMIFFVIIAQVVFPAGPVLGGPAHILLWVLWFVLRFVIITVAVALLEVSLAKMRLFRVADFLAFAFVLGAVAVVCAVLGV